MKSQTHVANDPLAPWSVSESDYPFSGETWERLSFCLNYAVLAPSSHNSQPWRFKLGLDEVRLYADRTRALPIVDPHDRELLMSCGAALFHLRLAIRYFGYRDNVFLFPEGTPAYAAAVRTFDLGKGIAAHNRKLIEGSPVLAVLTTDTDTPADWLSVGQALARVLLLACAHEVSASFLNQPIEVEELRPQFREALGLSGFPQLFLRMGYGPGVKPTPRRDVREVLI